MACNQSPGNKNKSLILQNNEYYEQTADCTLVEFNNKDTLTGEMSLVNLWWEEIMKKYGIDVCYYVNKFDIKTDDKLYGEARHKAYHDPKVIKMAVQYTSAAIMLGKFGFINDSDLIAYITFSKFEEAFVGDDIHQQLSDDIEPKAGDVIKLQQYGNDRVGKREGIYFEITSVTDEDIQTINQLGGHYVWMIKAKKFDNSFEENLDLAYEQNVVSDNSNVGLLSTLNLSQEAHNITPDKPYEFDQDEVSTDTIIDQPSNIIDDIYGGY